MTIEACLIELGPTGEALVFPWSLNVDVSSGIRRSASDLARMHYVLTVLSSLWPDRIGPMSGDAVVFGVGGGLGAVGDAGLGVDVAHVANHSIEADHELVRDLLIALAGGEKAQHFELAGREDTGNVGWLSGRIIF